MEKNHLTKEEAFALTAWFQKNERELPWRHTGDPYKVWISEIMLQQTRVESVISYFNRFIEVLPNIESLAACDDDTLMKLWEGLGYYSRARNLKKCAITVCEQLDGKLPENIEELKSLSGIGSYTAGAISALAFDKPVPAVDGNVLRVLSRLCGYTEDIRNEKAKRCFEDMISDFYETQDKWPNGFVSQLTQGFMELGALICIPGGTPHCEVCPWHKTCYACTHQLTDSIPYRSPLKKRRIEKRTVLVIRDGSLFLMHKREEKGLLAGLYEFVNTEGHLSKEEAIRYVENLGASVVRIKVLPEGKHIFSHIEWHMCAYEVRIASVEDLSLENSLLVRKKELQQLAIPSAFETWMSEYSLR